MLRHALTARILLCAAILFTLASTSRAQFALGTGFTYQGQLKDGGSPASGNFDFQFKLFDDPTAGIQQGPTLTANELAVSSGLFSTLLDFGPQFNGQKRWIEIGVRPGVDTDPDPYTLLTPRTELTASPNSIYALNAGHADTANDSNTLDSKDSLDFLEKDGRAFVIVRTTDNAVTNAANLQAAYNQAKALTPHGTALSADNRAVVLVPPGRYNLGADQLVMDTEFVDVIGLSSKADDQYIFGTTNGANTGVLRQTANNVGIENLRVRCTLASGPFISSAPNVPTAYFPDSNKPATVIRNCKFESPGSYSWSMRIGVMYSGRYEFCTAGDFSFGGGGGHASGTFAHCTGGVYAFGGYLGSTAAGTFIYCTGGDRAFGGEADATNGRFFYCKGGGASFTETGSPAPIQIFCTQGNVQYPGNN